MPRAEGHINYAVVERSPRLQRLLELLKKADHPLSGMEIQLQAWVTNASTSIAEIRGDKNREAGYLVSPATSWKGGKYPWHDGNPRYWLIAAPGWEPRWRVTKEGELLPCTAAQGAGIRSQETGVRGQESEVRSQEPEGNPDPLPRTCRLLKCGRPIPPDKPDNAAFCCDAHKDEYWKLIRDTGKAIAAANQGKLF